MEQLAAHSSYWNIYKRIAFRFVFIFFILFIILLDWSVNPLFEYLYYEQNLGITLEAIISWVGKYFFHISYTIIPPHDGQHSDKTYIYLLYFTMAVTAILGAIVWSVLDRKRTNYDRLYYWFTAIVRYYLAFTLFLFALEKFFKMQFPDLGLYTLTQPVGDMSPMSLAWAFFGYSYGYNFFMGIAESAALLLLFRRTMTFGAILTLFTLVNVIVVNYNYDVHAKMYPTALSAMTLFLLLPNITRLFNFFFTEQSISLPIIKSPVFKKSWMNITKTIFKVLLIGYFLIFSVKDYIGYRQNIQSREMTKARSGIAGVYDVQNFAINKDTVSNENPMRWKQMIIGGARERIRLKGDSILFMNVFAKSKEILVFDDRIKLAENEQQIYKEHGLSEETYNQMDSFLIARQIKSRFQFELTDSSTMMITGKIKNDSVFIIAKKTDLKVQDFRLMKRKFHWITEEPYAY